VERPTHTNTSWDQEKFEVPAQRWADLSEAYYGVSLLNDCKYGYDVRGNTLRLSLLRGAEWPDPHADAGEHELTYSLYPHPGDWRAAHTVERAAELNVPLMVASPDPAATRRRPGATSVPGSSSFLSVSGPAVVETWKPAEDGEGHILRLYEPCGGRGSVTVRSARQAASVASTNLVEEPLEDGAEAATLAPDGASFSFFLHPFEIRTFRVHWRS
jgi:alpha-mannosidase